MSERSPRSIEEILREKTGEWMAVPGVVGTGVGLCDGAPCIKVFVARRMPEVEERIPGEVEGHPVRIEVSGEFRPRDTAGG